MQKPFLFLFVVSCLPGCNLPLSNNTEIATTQPSTPPPFSEIVITDSADLEKHVGQIVTLIGKQTRTYIPRVLGVRVVGESSLSEKIVVVTGQLSSYQTTEEDVIAFHAANLARLAVPLPVVGMHYSITDPKTQDTPKTYLWNSEIKNLAGSSVPSDPLVVDTHSGQ